jgi:hypothetical protein
MRGSHQLLAVSLLVYVLGSTAIVNAAKTRLNNGGHWCRIVFASSH